MYRKHLLLLPVLVGLLLGLLFSAGTEAAEVDQDIGLSLRPAILDLPAEVGSTVTASIYIQNISGSAIGVEVGSQSLIPNDPDIDQQKRKDTDASTWMLTKGKKLLLEKDEQRIVDVQFLVPQEAGPGGHYALVTFTVSSSGQQTASGSVVSPSLSSLALINVAGEVHEEASIEGFKMPFLVFGEDQAIEFNIANTGNIHILPTANVKLYDSTDQLVDNIPIPPQLVLPNTTKSFFANWSTGGRIGVHRVEVEVAYGSPLQSVSLDSGTIILMPNLLSTVFGLSILLAVLFLVFFVLKKPLKRLFGKYGKLHLSIKPKKKPKPQNRPQDMARLSMSPGKIDELLSQNRRTRPQPTTVNRPKKKKYIIR